METKKIFLLVILFVLTLWRGYAALPKRSLENQTSVSGEALKPKKRKSFDDSLTMCKRYEGLFKIYQDTATGALYMSIKKTQVGKEYVYFNYAENGLISQAAFRGAYRDNKIVQIRKHLQKIEFVVPNIRFLFDTSSALSKSASANISESILISQKILSYDSEWEEYLIAADDIFVAETMHRIKPSPPRGVPADSYFSLGSLSKTKSKVKRINNYPLNTEIRVEYTFENPYPSVGGGVEVADDRNVSITLQHSFVEVPKNNFKPRKDDPRLGFFAEYRNEMTTKEAVNYADVIHRWHLEKKDSSLELSEPKIPIVWWIENTTPKELIPWIERAVLAWNPAFEAAGFKNALQVKIQPDTATWDAGDIRYNVLRWTSSPNPIFGGYGPSFVDPRTGQILGADIMLEWIFLTNRLKSQQFFESNALTQVLENHLDHSCHAGMMLQHQIQMANLALHAFDYDTIQVDTFMKQAIFYLVLHELGHTLGLNHNMKASQMLCPEDLNNKSKTSKTGLTASVMDYPAINFAGDPKKQGDYYTWKPGPYDIWAIQYGYQSYANDAEEEEGLRKLLNRSTEPALAFGNDADDMRSPGLHLDPRIQIMDLSCDPLLFMEERMKVIQKVQTKLLTKYVKSGKSYQEVKNAIQIISTEQSNMANIASRYVGGVYVDRNYPEQKSKSKPYEPVPLEVQRRAFNFINTYYFKPDALKIDPSVYPYLQSQRRGFYQYGYNDDPKPHDRVLAIQKVALDHWLHPNTTKRMIDTELYGNKYTQSMFFKDLTQSICLPDLANTTNNHRRNLQIEYVQRLISISKVENVAYDYITKANALAQLLQIKSILTAANPLDLQSKNHKQYMLYLIDKILENKKG